MKVSKGKLQSNYTSFAEFEQYSKLYNLHARLNYITPKAAWDANPLIQWSVTPSDFKIVKEPRTLVRFLIHKDSGELFAFFPQLNWNKYLYGNNMKTCYSHVGQHSGCLSGYIDESKPANPAEYSDLKKELEKAGYKLKIVGENTAKQAFTKSK